MLYIKLLMLYDDILIFILENGLFYPINNLILRLFFLSDFAALQKSVDPGRDLAYFPVN